MRKSLPKSMAAVVGIGLLLAGCGMEGELSTTEGEVGEPAQVETRSNPLIVHTVNGADDTWSRADRLNVSFCVPTGAFGAQRGRVVDFLYRAMSEWENAANVRFVHKTGQDASCTNTNANVKFNVRYDVNTVGAMGYPSFPRASRELIVGNPTTWTDEFLLAVLTHELGHGLGFVHEHFRVPGQTGNCAGTENYRALTGYDNMGALHYIDCPNYFDGTAPIQPNFISQWDTEGAQSVYEAPSNVVNTSSGTVYARKRSNGYIYKWNSGTSWTQIGTPKQAIVAVGNVLYGQAPGRGAVYQYSGTGSTWNQIGYAAGQIFSCATTLCATDPNTKQIARYNGAAWSWNFVGDGGNQFAGTDSQLFGIGPSQNYVARWSGIGTFWNIVGSGGAAQLIGGGTSMYRVTVLLDQIQKYAANTWTRIGYTGRQFLATNSYVYGLRPDRGYVMKYNTTQWNSVHGPADRLHGQYGALFAENSSGIIERYNVTANTWTSLDQP